MKVPDLPPPRSNQAYCDVSALEGGVLKLPCALMVSTAAPDETLVAPALSFLLTHSESGARMLFDLGICKDIEASLTPTIVDRAKKVFNTTVPQDVPESLSKGGLTPDDVECVCLSHVHCRMYTGTTSETHLCSRTRSFFWGLMHAHCSTQATQRTLKACSGRTSSPSTAQSSWTRQTGQR